MTSNYCAFQYGNSNSSYSQNQQSFPDQYTSSAAAAAPQASQAYYNGSQTQSRQAAPAARQAATESRSSTTQYNGLHFPTQTPSRQTNTYDSAGSVGSGGVASAGGVGRSGASNVKANGAHGLYQSSGNTSGSQARQRADVAAARGAHDRPEHALSSSGWNAGSSGSSASQAASTDYGYSYNKPDVPSQQTYYANQRASAAPSSTQKASSSTSYGQNSTYSSSAPQASSTPSQSTSQRHSNQGYWQPAQSSTATSYSNRNYETPPAKTTKSASNTASTYQQSTDYGKSYQEDTDQTGSYLHRVYTLPQPTPTRNAPVADNSNSYFSGTHGAETSYTSSSQTSKPSNAQQVTASERSGQDSGRSSSGVNQTTSYNYGSSAPAQSNQQQYYPDYTSANTAQPQPASYSAAPATTAVTNQSTPAQATFSTPQPPAKSTPASRAKKPRQSASQKSPTAKPYKPRAPRKSKGSAASPAAIDLTGSSQQTASLPQAHTFYPSGSAATNSSSMLSTQNAGTAAPQEQPSGQPLSAGSSAAEMDMTTMEQHMREMVEKMREYQSRDPSAFQQVWENVKRAGPSAAGGKALGSQPMSASKSTASVNSPQQAVANLAKPVAARQSTPTPLPGSAASQAQKTVWPATQKDALSQTTSKLFRSLRQSCSVSYVMGLLDSGPTFSELCQKLEANGYKFERNKLAIALLKTSESVDASGKVAASTAVPAISAAESTASFAKDVPPRTLTPQAIKSFNPRNIKDSIPNYIPQDHNQDQSQNFVTPSMIFNESTFTYPTRFSQPESNIRSDEPIAPPTPAAAPASSPQPIPEKPAKTKTKNGKKRVSMANLQQRSSSQTPQTPQMAPGGTQSQALVAPQPSFPTSREESMPDASPISVTKPISRYESLLQPDPPVSPFVESKTQEDNSALKRLQEKLDRQMNLLKDLETPEELPQPPPAVLPSQRASIPPPPPPPPPPRKATLPRPPSLDKKKALRRNTYDPRTIVHAVLQSTGRHPHYEGLNSRLAILKRLHPDVFDNTTDLARIPWDLYDPPPAPRPGEVKKVKKSTVVDEEDTRGRKREPAPFPPGFPRVDPADVPPGVLRTEPDPSVPVIVDGKIRGKRGRPRGSRGILRAARGGRGGVKTGATTGQENNTTAGDTSTAANAHKYGVIRVNIDSLKNSVNGNNGDRKRKYDGSPDPRHPGDGYHWANGSAQLLPVFKCQWENCNYELQNLDTLRRHLIKKHKAENKQGVMPCCWGKCGTLIPIGRLDPATGKHVIEHRRRRLNFGTELAWDNHVLGEHLKVVRDELGEGMSVSVARSISRASSAHSIEGRLRSMSRDRNGRSVTPVITPAPYGYKFTPPPGFTSGSQFRLAHEFPQEIDSDTDEQKLFDDELARAGRIGTGMESFGLLEIPGLDNDSGEGWIMKVRKLTTDLTKVPPLPPAKPIVEGGDGNVEQDKGKGRADD